MTLRVKLQISDMNVTRPGGGDTDFTEGWTTIPALISFKLTWANGEQSGELEAIVGNHPLIPKLNPFQRVRLFSVDLGIVLWIGRIMVVKPAFSGTLQGGIGGAAGRAFTWEIYARDYMYALIDNFVQADKMNPTLPFTAADDATYVPIYFGGDTDFPPPLGFQASSRFQIISDLVTNLTGQDLFRSVTMPFGADSVQIERNYMSMPQQTVSEAVFQLAQEAPWDAIPSGIGFVFRVAPPGQFGDGAVFQYFQRSGIVWDSTQTFGWAAPPSPAIIPILDFHSEQEGLNIFSRSRILGKGLASQPSQTATVPGMEDIWNPDSNQFMVTRETTSYDDILANFNDLNIRASTLLMTQPTAYRGPAIGQIRVIGVPQNAGGVVPIPGDVIELNPAPPDLTDSTTGNKFVIDQWVYEWPEGISTYILNRRPRVTSIAVLQTLARRGLNLLTSLKNYADTGWFIPLDTSAPPSDPPPPGDSDPVDTTPPRAHTSHRTGPHIVQDSPPTTPTDTPPTDTPGGGIGGVGFNLTVPHQFGVIPRYVQIYAAAGTDDLTSNDPPSAILIPNWYYIPDGSQEGDAGCVGVQITSLTTEHVVITICPRFGFSAAVPGGQGRFLATGDALRVIMEP